MIWLLASLLSAFSKAGEKLLHRKIMINANCYAYSFIYNIIGSACFIPLLILFGFNISTNLFAWAMMLLATIIYVAMTIIIFESYKHAEVSLREPIGSIRLIIVFVLSFIFLHESFTINRLAGTLLIVFALITMSFKNGKLNFKDKGIKLTIVGGMLAGITPPIEKYLLGFFEPLSLAFLLFLLPSIGLIFFMKGRKKHLTELVSGKTKYFVFGSAFLCFVGYTARIWAFSLADVSLVYPIFSISTIIASILAIWLLKERKNVTSKIIGILLAFAGSILIII